MSFLKILPAAALAVALAAAPAGAQSLKIGTFDPNKILTGSRLGQRLQDDMNQYRVQKEGDIQKQKDDYDKLANQYKSGSDSMSPDRKASVEDDLLKRRRDLERAIDDVQAELQRRREKAIHELEEQVAKVLDDYGKKNGYTLILQADLCAFSLPSIDISDDIVKLVDAATASGGGTSAPASHPAGGTKPTSSKSSGG